MKKIKLLTLLLLMCTGKLLAQDFPAGMSEAIVKDDSVGLAKVATKDNMNVCGGAGGYYSPLAQTIRSGAPKCFNLLIAMGADVNIACKGNVPPLFHAAKYGRLEMAKVMVAKGADPRARYTGTLQKQATGKAPLEYAEASGQPGVAAYLRSLKPDQ